MNGDFIKRGGPWVVGQFVLMATLAAVGPLAGALSLPWFVAGLPFMALGAWLGIAGVRELGAARTPFPEPLESATLVTTGIYGRVRHPLYASLIWLGFGWAVMWASPTTGIVAVAQAVFLFFKARREEAYLRGMHPGYDAYCARVRRFIPIPR